MYDTSIRHILAELERLDLLLRVQVWRARQGIGDAGEMAAFYIADTEAEELLNNAVGAPIWAGVPLPPELQAATQAELDRRAADIAQHTAQSLRAGVPLRLAELARTFELTGIDVDAVLLCLAAELDRGYGRLYAYLHDDLSRRQPTVELAVNLFCPDLDAKVAARQRFAATAPLRRFRLMELAEEPGSLLGSTLRLEPRVVRFLLDDAIDDAIDDRLASCAGIAAAARELILPGSFGERLTQLTDHIRMVSGPPPLVYFQGPHGAGKRTAAAACSQALGRPLLVVEVGRLAAAGAGEFAALVRVADREARLRGALICWAGIDALLTEENSAWLAELLAAAGAFPGPVFASGTVSWEPATAWRGRTYLRIEIPPPGPPERQRIWQLALTGEDLGLDLDLDLDDLAGRFRLSGGQISAAAASARHLALARDPAAPRVTAADLHAACRLHSNRKLAELAVKITPHYTWDDIVLPADQMAQLREIYDQVRHRALVYDTWGFDGKLAMGKGLSILFAGPSGTGKTMAADVLASALGLSLYKIDLSAVVSKYIGETEKNLSRIFAEAATSNAILFFDEADALFGKRTQIRDAHDRYANVEISYLLQKMEEYDGLVVLATNLRKNMDEAFVRRLHVAVDFPVPGVADRRRIWARIWPAATPRDAGLDLDYLASRVEVAGGSIRNIALASAFLAAADGGVVTMAHLLHATRREYQKIGKVLTTGEFGG